jgi:hypothetical protein
VERVLLLEDVFGTVTASSSEEISIKLEGEAGILVT